MYSFRKDFEDRREEAVKLIPGYEELTGFFERSTNIFHCYQPSTEFIISKAQGTEEMKELLGENFLNIFESNPIPISLEVQLNADYFSPDSVALFSQYRFVVFGSTRDNSDQAFAFANSLKKTRNR